MRLLLEPLRAALAFLGARATWMLVAAMFAGFVVPQAADVLRPWLWAIVLALLTNAFARIDLTEAFLNIRRPKALALALLAMLVGAPLLFAAFWFTTGAAAWMPAGVALALAIVVAAPPVGSSPALCMILGLDGALALVLTIAATMMTPVVAPLITHYVLDVEAPLSSLEMTKRLGALVGGAFVAGRLLRHTLGPRRIARLKFEFDGIAVVCLALFAISLMEGFPEIVAARPGWVALLAAVAFAINLSLLLASQAMMRIAGVAPRPAATIGFCVGNRNMGLIVSVLPPALVDADLWIYFVVFQIPIYTFPLLLRPFYARLPAAAPTPN